MRQADNVTDAGTGPAKAPAGHVAGRRTTYVCILTFMLLAGGIIASGYLCYRHFQRQQRTEVEKQLSAIADLKMNELAEWKSERMGDAEVFYKNPGFSALAGQFFNDPNDAGVQEQIQVWLGRIASHAHCDRVVLLDARGTERTTIPPRSKPVDPPVVREAHKALQSGKIEFLDFYLCEEDRDIYLAILIPILSGQDNRKLGVLAICIDPEKQLYPSLEGWPIPSETAEALLVRRDGDDVVFLNKLRFQDDRPLKLRVPLKENANLVATKAVTGHEGIVAGVDYRGVAALAAVRPVPGSSWFLVVRMDESEVYAPIQEQLWMILASVVSLIVGAGVTVGMFQWRHRLGSYRQELAAARRLRESEQAASRQAAKLTAMIAGMDEGVVFADAEGVVVEINDYLCRFAGKSRHEILGRRIEELHVGPTRENLLRLIERFRANIGYPPLVLQRPIGSAEVLMRAQPIYCDGKYDGVLLNVIDVTELVQARKDLEARNSELDSLNRQLERAVNQANTMAARAETANVAKSEFLANMSHEIRTPLTAILGYAEQLTEDGISLQERQGHSKVILRNGRHLLELINDILDISKIEADMLVLERRPCSVCAIVADVVSMMRVRAIEKNLALTVRYVTPVPQTILADEARLRQTLINLVGNAVKFTESGEVTVSVALADGRPGVQPAIRIDVADTGIGIEPETIERLFQPFVQADSSTTRKFGGTGLGLTITRRIIEKMGGKIEVRSAPEKGSTFTLIVPTGPLEGIPMVEQAPEAVMPAPEPRPNRTECVRPLQGVRILLAEDGPDNQLLIRTILSKAGAEVEVAGNGLLAAWAATQRPFDLVLMDMQMPEMDGYQAAGVLRTQGYEKPIVALTAHALSSDRERCLDAGCTDYMTKPINRVALIEMILKHTAGRQAPARTSAAPAEGIRWPAGQTIVSQLANDENMAEIVASFVQQLPKRCRAMTEALRNGDLPTLHRLAHQMKGAGGTHGFPMLTQAGRELESAAKAGDQETCQLTLRIMIALCQAVARGWKAKATAE